MPASGDARRAQGILSPMKKTYVFREAWPYHFDPLFDWISALPIYSSAKLLPLGTKCRTFEISIVQGRGVRFFLVPYNQRLVT